MNLRPRTPWRGWLAGLLLALLAVAMRISAQPLIGDHLPFVFAFPATVLAAVVWGAGPGILVASVSAVAAALPAFAGQSATTARPLQVGAFLVGCILISLVCGRLATRQRIEPAMQTMTDEPETPLTAWLRAVLWGAFLVPLTAFVVITWWGYERAREEAETTVARACELAYRHAQRSFEIVSSIAARADAASAGDDEAVRAREAEVHQRFADMTAGLPSIVNLNVWDASGRPIVRSDFFPVDLRATVEDRAYFREQRAAPQRLGISEVIRGRQTGLELTNATVRRTSPDGSFRGVVAVSMAPEFFREYYRSLAKEQPNLASFTLARTDGEIIARWPPEPDGRRRVPPDGEILARISAGELSGNVVIPERAGRETRLASFRRLQGLPLYVVAGVSRQATLANWVRFVTVLATVLIPITCGLVYVSWVALKKTRGEAATAARLRQQILRRASAERAMVETQRLETLAVVTGGVAHDFNNLLAVVNASLHVLKRTEPGLASNKQVVAMTRAIQSGVRLTRQLLSFSRKQALRPESIELQNWLPATEGLMRSTLGSGIAWESKVEPDTQPIKVDLGELELALINLVVNARHAMPQGGTLRVAARNDAGASPERPMVVISVHDTGVGIAPEILDKVFEPFYTTRTKGAGSGLGLSQVRGFCIEAGGAVEIDSVVGGGTAVHMRLPGTSEVPVPDGSSPAEALQTMRGRVLLVEDNHDVASTTEQMLRTAGLEVVVASSGDAAWSYLQSADPLPDVVLSDVAMPGTLDGIALAFAIRKSHPALPVVLTTGYAERLDAAVAGGFRVLAKPVAPEQLLQELSEASASLSKV